LNKVRLNLEHSLAERIAQDQMQRKPCWTEALAVGSRDFVEELEPHVATRRETEIVESETGWVLRDASTPYRSRTGLESGCNKLSLFAVRSQQIKPFCRAEPGLKWRVKL
jgi:hypothetical protein